jgi:hypothetical protein
MAMRILVATIAALVVACQGPVWKPEAPHPTRDEILALARLPPGTFSHQPADMAVWWYPAQLLSGGNAWLHCFVPPKFEARTVTLAVPSLGIETTRSAEWHRSRLVERIPCGRHMAVCVAVDGRGRRQQRERVLEAHGGC